MGTDPTRFNDILLVEDDRADAELTLAALQECRTASKVAVADNGAEALDYLYRRGNFSTRLGGAPILVLLDLKLPKVNGLEVLKIMKSDDYLKVIPVIILSSSRETRDLIECYKHGANAYVVKPVDFDKFMKALKQIGIFWTEINEPPPIIGMEDTPAQSGEVISPGKRENGIKNPASHPAPGG
jgi:CheY-like chemotaxis protein